DCFDNTTDALTAGGACIDNTGVCGGTQYTASCSNIEYIRSNYPDTGKCPGIGCDGTVAGTATVQWYYKDADGDGLGSVSAGWYCSTTAAAETDPKLVVTSTDFDDSCACTSVQGNDDASCYDCLGNCIDDSPSDYIGDSSGKDNACTGDYNNRKGCDVCGVCDGSGYTRYTDADSDGWGTGTANSCTSGATNSSDLDDTCDCFDNTTDALTAGGACIDECGICGGDGYEDNCINIEYIRAY
ncbi:uncharacterized protein METZ01_LOCUS482260, partial [marine metagenome]